MLKLLDPDASPIFRALHDVSTANRTSLVGPTAGQAFPPFSAAERARLKTLTRGVFSIASSGGVVQLMSGWNHNRKGGARSGPPPCAQTADFSKLYTMLSKDDIRTAAHFWVHEIFDKKPAGNWGIRLTLNKATLRYDAAWHQLPTPTPPMGAASQDGSNPRNNPRCLTFTAAELLDVFAFYLEHTFMVFNGKVYHHQINGIPMGLEFSVMCASPDCFVPCVPAA